MEGGVGCHNALGAQVLGGGLCKQGQGRPDMLGQLDQPQHVLSQGLPKGLVAHGHSGVGEQFLQDPLREPADKGWRG
eukprot:15466463-Alexandrium_andersonii.AAC.2